MPVTLHPFTAAQYHADPAPVPSLSSSIASILLNQSPAHAWLQHPKLNPNYQPETSSRFDLGSAAHLMLLERRSDAIIVVDAPDWRTKAAKEQRDAAQAAGCFAVLAHQHAAIVEMVSTAKAFIQTTELAGILETGIAEQTVMWQEGETWCRARPDLISADGNIVLDYKTTGSAAAEAFIQQIGRMGYDMQSEFYLRGIESDDPGRNDTTFLFLAQEITEPYACTLHGLANTYRAIGQSKVQRALDRWSHCMASNKWPAYTTQIHWAEPKPWDLIQLDEEPKETEQCE